MKKNIIIIYIFTILVGCSYKQPVLSQSATIIFKTPLIKFYDKSFITHYTDHIHLQIFNASSIALDLKIYKNKICKDFLQCVKAHDFNIKYLNKNYDDDFMFKLFKKDTVYFKDKKNNILIEIRKD